MLTSLATAAHASTTPRTTRDPAFPASGSVRDVPIRRVRTSAAVRIRLERQRGGPGDMSRSERAPGYEVIGPPGRGREHVDARRGEEVGTTQPVGNAHGAAGVATTDSSDAGKPGANAPRSMTAAKTTLS